MFAYVDKYGAHHRGRLSEIGDALIEDQGDWRLQDNPEPWYLIDEMGNVDDRKFGIPEWLEWCARFEDRTVQDVVASLTAIDEIPLS